jgi:hypothetical protein
VDPLSLTSLAQIEVGTVSAPVADTANRHHSTGIAQTSSVDASITPGVILGDAEEEVHNVVPGSLRGWKIPRVIPPVLS